MYFWPGAGLRSFLSLIQMIFLVNTFKSLLLKGSKFGSFEWSIEMGNDEFLEKVGQGLLLSGALSI
jgi:hypothetical protein